MATFQHRLSNNITDYKTKKRTSYHITEDEFSSNSSEIGMTNIIQRL